ncbi:hematopoietic progenitor cell antigen CD34 [Emys orbicularis]|uniref:hematopoietic progenitor cell antigen CD34 n=1 Tax=Emys orbicularis TaxID=82168 RepID=UPI0031FD6009
MLLLGSLKAMKRKQLFWTMFYVLSLMDNKVSGGNNHSSSATTSPSAMNATITSVTPAITTVTLTETMEPKTISPTPEGKASTTEMTKVTEDTSPATSAGPTQAHTDVSDQSVSVKTSPDSQPNTSHAPFSTTAQAMTLEMVSTATTTVLTEQTSHSATTGPPPSSTVKPSYTFACQNIKHVKKPRVICLHLSEPDTCNNFRKTKGENLSMVICDTTSPYNHFSSPPCHIELAKSEVDPSCMLLIQAGMKDADAIEKLLQERQSDLIKIGIKSHQLESIGRHQNIPRNTLIALVTSGLLLAFLSLAGYFLMKRRSWSPRGERLDEDLYYTENGSQGNTGITVASQEHSEPQEKPNLNRGAQKNGTGQASSKNGHSARQHIVADTEL